MANDNYTGSVAQRFFQFTTGLATTEDVEINVFDSIAIYIPSDEAADNIVDYDGSSLTADVPVVKTVTADNYTDVLKGDLLTNWAPIFNDGANLDVTLYIVVFLSTEAISATRTEIEYAPLTKAFELTFASAFFKVLHSKASALDRSSLQLCLAQLCEKETKLSYHLMQVTVDPADAADTCAVLTLTRAEEREAVKVNGLVTPAEDQENPREKYLWGMLDFINASNTFLLVHSEDTFIIPIMFAQYYAEGRNGSGTYIGNKIAKVRLGGGKVKPTGTPSVLNSEINTNLTEAQYTILDDKNCEYLMSIADSTQNNSIVVREKGITGVPLSARSISKYVDYTTSQQLAKLVTDKSTTTSPYLRNMETYEIIKQTLLGNLQLFSAIGKITDIATNFPAFEDLPESKTDITVTSGWSAYYVSDLEKVRITGTINY